MLDKNKKIQHVFNQILFTLINQCFFCLHFLNKEMFDFVKIVVFLNKYAFFDKGIG